MGSLGPAGQPGLEDKQDFPLWQGRAKNWYLPRFQKIGAEIDYVGGSDLDRFSKYQFGFFGGTRVHGYQSNRVRAEEAWATHLSYGFEIGEFLRLDAVADAAWPPTRRRPRQRAAGRRRPRRVVHGTLADGGQPRRGRAGGGPDDGFVLYLVFLKLFR